MSGRTVLTLYQSQALAEAAVRDLKDAGFTDEEIGVAMQEPSGQRDREEVDWRPDARAEPARDGGLAGGLVGLLGSLSIPGLGPLLLGGVMASALAGADSNAAAGGLIRPLVGAGVSHRDAERLERGLRAGEMLVTVTAASRVAEAVAIIQRHHPEFTSIGSLGWAIPHEPPDRRCRVDPSYSGPERRLATA